MYVVVLLHHLTIEIILSADSLLKVKDLLNLFLELLVLDEVLDFSLRALIELAS